MTTEHQVFNVKPCNTVQRNQISIDILSCNFYNGFPIQQSLKTKK